MVTFAMNIPQMLAYIPYMDTMGMVFIRSLAVYFGAFNYATGGPHLKASGGLDV